MPRVSNTPGRIEGNLYKYSEGRGKGWQQRFFVLRNNTLTWFEKKDPQTLFNELDANGLGFLNRDEIQNLFKSLGMKIKGNKLDYAMAAMDDGSGEIGFDEFHKWWTEFGGKSADKRSAVGEVDLSAPDVQIEPHEVVRCSRLHISVACADMRGMCARVATP